MNCRFGNKTVHSATLGGLGLSMKHFSSDVFDPRCAALPFLWQLFKCTVGCVHITCGKTDRHVDE